MRKFFYLVATLFFMSSCNSYRQLPYFQDLKSDSTISEEVNNYSPLKIQKDDLLAINVSSLNQEASAIFNVGNTTSAAAGVTGSMITRENNNNGFMVDQNGNIQLPLLNSIKVEGLTTAEARELIQEKLKVYLKEPVVGLRLVNFKVSVLGDVARPGVFPSQSEKVSITDALSLAGDLNITAISKNVLLVREIQGKRQYIKIDLTNRNLFSSPYFYLQNNDLIYVQPGKSKYANADASYRNISLLLSALSVITLIITRL